MAYFLEQVAPPNNASPLIINISGSRFTIGRHSVAELRNLLKVSRRHAVFRQTRKGLSVKDLGSKYGLYINSAKIDGNLSCDVKPGDLIGLGVADESSIEHGFLGKLCRRTDLEDGLITISDDDEDVPTNSKLNNKGLADQQSTEIDILGDDCIAISNVTVRLNTIQLIDLEKEPGCITLTEDTTTRSERPKSNIIDLVDLTAESENDTGYLHLTTVEHESESAPSKVERDKRIKEKEASFREDVESDQQINKKEANSQDNVQSGEQISDNSLEKVKSDKQINNKEAYSQDNVQSDQQNNKNSQENVQSDQQINNKVVLKPCRIILKKIDPSDFMCSSKENSLSHKYVNTEIRARTEEYPLAPNELTVTSSTSNSKDCGQVLLNKSKILCNDENSLNNKSIPPFYSGGLFPNNTSDNEQHFVNNITKSLTDGLEMEQNVISPKVSLVCSKESQTDFAEQQQNIPLPEVITRRKRCDKEAVRKKNKRKKRENGAVAQRKKKPPKYEDDSEWSSDVRVKRSKLLLKLSKVSRNSDVLNSENSNKFLSNYRTPKKNHI